MYRLDTGPSSGGTATSETESDASDAIDGPILALHRPEKDTGDAQQHYSSGDPNGPSSVKHMPNMDEVAVSKNSNKKAVPETSLVLIGIFDVAFDGISSSEHYTPAANGNNDHTSSSPDKDFSQNDQLNLFPCNENRTQQEEMLERNSPAFSDNIQGTSDSCHNSSHHSKTNSPTYSGDCDVNVEVFHVSFAGMSSYLCSSDVDECSPHPQQNETHTPQKDHYALTDGDELHNDNQSVNVESYTVSFGGIHSFTFECGSHMQEETGVGY